MRATKRFARRTRARRPRRAAEYHYELVPPDPRNRVLDSDLFLEPTADLSEHFIANVMAEPVVDGLEVVQVEVGEAEDIAEPARVRDRR